MADNSREDVTNIKGVDGGYGFSAAAGTTVPSIGNAPGDSFANLGFISNNGIEESLESDKTEVVDMNGNVVYVMTSKETEKEKITLISFTEAALKEMHGHDNVSSTSSLMTIQHKTTDREQRVYVFDLLLKDGRAWRKVIPCGQVTEVGPIVHGAGNVFGREITITCAPDSDGVRIYDYIQVEASTTTTTTTGE